MKKTEKTNEQLLKEIDQLRIQNAKLEDTKNDFKKNEEKLLKSEEKYKGIIQSTASCIAVYQAIEKGKNFVIVDFNQMAEKVEQISKDKVIGKKVTEVFPGVEEFGLFKVFQNVWKTGKPEHFPVSVYQDERIQGYRENYIYKLSTGEIVAVYQDFTERKQAEEALRESEEVFSGFINSATDGIIMYDSDLNLIEINKAGLEIFPADTTKEKLIGKNMLEIAPTIKETGRYEKYLNVIKTGESLVLNDIISDPKFGNRYLTIKAFKVGEGLGLIFNDTTEKKKTDEQIKRFSRIFEDSLNEIFLFDEATLKFIQVNNAAQNNLGYSMAELQKMTPLDIKPEFTAELFTKLVAPLNKGKKQKIFFETVHQRKDKSLYDVEVHLQLLHFENEDIFAAIIMDITERKKAEGELRTLSLMVEQSTEGMALADLNGTLLFSNMAWCKMHGYENPKDYLGESLSIFHNKEQLKNDVIPFNKKVKKHDKYSGEVGHITKEGKIFPTFMTSTLLKDLQGNPFAIAGVVNDITDRKQAENILALQKQKLTDILEGTNAGTWDWNIPSGKCVFNDRWAEIMGYTLDELKPIDINTWINNVHPDDLPNANALLDKHFKGELNYFDVVFRQPHKDGSWVWVNARGKVVEWSDDGKPLQMSGTHLDITERKLAEEELAKHHEQLEELVKERTQELEEKNKRLDDSMKVFVGREMMIKKLQDRIKALGGK